MFFSDKHDSDESASVLKDLETIDEQVHKSDIVFVKVSDEVLALEFGLETLPALLYYRNKVPLLFDGKLFFHVLFVIDYYLPGHVFMRLIFG